MRPCPRRSAGHDWHSRVSRRHQTKKREEEGARGERPRLLVVASPPVGDEPAWGGDEDGGEEGPPERLGRSWAAGWETRVVMRERCEDLDCHCGCPHTRVTMRSERQPRKHLRHIRGDFTSPQHLNERIKAAEFVWGCEGDSACNGLIGRCALLAWANLGTGDGAATTNASGAGDKVGASSSSADGGGDDEASSSSSFDELYE